MLDAERCRRILREGFPGLDVRDVRYFAQGWDYELWEVNGELLFRFPMREVCAEPLRKEVRLLPELADALPVPIPRPAYASHGCEAFEWPFYGYRKIPGVPLSEASLSQAQRESVARELGRFLSELHRFPIERAEALGVQCFSPEGWRAHYRAFGERSEREVSPLLSPDERAAVATFWRSFLGDDRYFTFRPTLIHRDLGLDHVLVDPERGTLTGVIDFGDAVVGDPALDFVGYDVEFREAVFAAYDQPVDETFLARAEIYLQIGPFHEVRYGFEIDRSEHIEAGLDGIKKRIVDRA